MSIWRILSSLFWHSIWPGCPPALLALLCYACDMHAGSLHLLCSYCAATPLLICSNECMNGSNWLSQVCSLSCLAHVCVDPFVRATQLTCNCVCLPCSQVPGFASICKSCSCSSKRRFSRSSFLRGQHITVVKYLVQYCSSRVQYCMHE